MIAPIALACIIAIAGCGGMVATEEAHVDAGRDAPTPVGSSCPATVPLGAVAACPSKVPVDGSSCSTGSGICMWFVGTGCTFASAQCVAGTWHVAPAVCDGGTYEPEGA